ncbi:MAG: hypothetical protein GX997_02000 [Bacteroidales bacterium]|nr:hypothetical protein [Bacteroidales bacterium]
MRKAADKDVKLLMNVLVVQAAMEGESRYRELTGELGKLFAYYWNTLAVRRGRRAVEKAMEGAQTPPAIGGMKKGGRIATAAKEANSRPANTAERKGHQVAAAVTDRKGRHAAAEQGAGTPPAITGMRKRRHAAVEAEGKKNTESPPANIEVPARAPIVRALTPHENYTRPAIVDARKERRIAAVEKAKEEAETRQEIVGVRKSIRIKIAEKTEEETEGTESPPAITGMRKGSGVTAEKDSKAQPTNAGIPARAPLIRAATPHKNAALPARKVGFESDVQRSE